MFRPIRAALTATLLSGLPALAQADGSRLSQAMAICLDNFPNMGGARTDAMIAGYQSIGNGGGFEIFITRDRDVVAGYSTTGQVSCLFGLDGLRDQRAIDAAAQLVVERFGANIVRVGPSGDGNFLDGWVVAAPQGGLLVGVRRQQNLAGVWHGSLIQVEPFEPPTQ